MTAGFNFLEQPELPAPQVSDAQAEHLLLKYYGINARAESLGSQQDKNFLVLDSDDRPFAVLKIANPAFSAVELAAQDAAAELIADAEPTLRVAAPLPNLAGESCTAVTGLLDISPVASLAPDGTAYVRLLPYLQGGTLVGAGHLSPAVVAGMGDLAGRVSRALAGFRHPGLDRALQWDLRVGHDVVETLVSHVGDASHRERLTAASNAAWARIAPLADELRRQAVHLDLTDANVVATHAGPGPDGIIDFGDLSDTWAVSELAITLSSVLGHPGTTPTSILPGIKAFHAVRPLIAAEADVLWPLLVLRTAVLIVSGAQQAALDPDNAYVTDQSDDEWRMFEQATSVPVDVMTGVIRAELGLAETQAVVTGEPLITGLDPVSVTTLDLSPTSGVYDDAFEPGAWLPAGVEDELARAAVRDGASLVVTRF
ncbi:MAG: 4-aminobutyrate aminotransferase, partial [Mycobacterium sp.]|nr:4-aminobutyrate aminotransferase [Mycobacterium sp.]